eukprot:scaffold7712_cov119-Isochrysis_galbana.AAC.4
MSWRHGRVYLAQDSSPPRHNQGPRPLSLTPLVRRLRLAATRAMAHRPLDAAAGRAGSTANAHIEPARAELEATACEVDREYAHRDCLPNGDDAEDVRVPVRVGQLGRMHEPIVLEAHVDEGSEGRHVAHDATELLARPQVVQAPQPGREQQRAVEVLPGVEPRRTQRLDQLLGR